MNLKDYGDSGDEILGDERKPNIVPCTIIVDTKVKN